MDHIEAKILAGTLTCQTVLTLFVQVYGPGKLAEIPKDLLGATLWIFVGVALLASSKLCGKLLLNRSPSEQMIFGGVFILIVGLSSFYLNMLTTIYIYGK